MNPRLSLLVLVAALMVSVSLALSLPGSNPLSKVGKDVPIADPGDDDCVKVTYECFLNAYHLLPETVKYLYKKDYQEARKTQGPVCALVWMKAITSLLEDTEIDAKKEDRKMLTEAKGQLFACSEYSF